MNLQDAYIEANRHSEITQFLYGSLPKYDPILNEKRVNNSLSCPSGVSFALVKVILCTQLFLGDIGTNFTPSS